MQWTHPCHCLHNVCVQYTPLRISPQTFPFFCTYTHTHTYTPYKMHEFSITNSISLPNATRCTKETYTHTYVHTVTETAGVALLCKPPNTMCRLYTYVSTPDFVDCTRSFNPLYCRYVRQDIRTDKMKTQVKCCNNVFIFCVHKHTHTHTRMNGSDETKDIWVSIHSCTGKYFRVRFFFTFFSFIILKQEPKCKINVCVCDIVYCRVKWKYTYGIEERCPIKKSS